MDKESQNTRDEHFKHLFKDAKTIEPLDSEMLIVVPTLGREDNQRVFNQLPPELKKICKLATKESHVEKLRKHNPDAEILVLPDDTDGIAQTRQRCIDLLPKGKVWMVDDLVKFQTRDENLKVLGWATHDEIKETYNAISRMLDHYAQVGLSSRPGNDKRPVYKSDCSRVYTCYGLRTDILENLNIRFDDMYNEDNDIKFFEDFYVNLSLITKGYPNTLLNEYIAEHTHNRKGGNSLIRTNELQAKSAQVLHSKFPNFVKLKVIEGCWGSEMSNRTDVTIQWKKAFNAESELTNNLLF
jgi:hypothetical protein